jgi:hypothetical protein
MRELSGLGGFSSALVKAVDIEVIDPGADIESGQYVIKMDTDHSQMDEEINRHSDTSGPGC